MKRGVIFDLDGVLVDTEPLHEQARQEIYRRYAIPPEVTEHIPAVGRGTDDIFRDVHARHPFPGDDLARPIAEKRALFNEFIETGLDLLPGVRSLIRVASDRGLTIALGTASHRASALHILRTTEVAHYFTVVVAAEDVRQPKPHPETYLMVLKELGEDGDRARSYLLFEDSDIGMQAGRAAGLEVVGVNTGSARATGACADLLVESIRDGWNEIMARLCLGGQVVD